MHRSATQTFGKYQILERIATGGMAEIYRARLEGIGGFQRTVAIKRILPNLMRHRHYVEMLADEARVAGMLSHANIVQILDLGEAEGIWYLAMEYVHGRDLGAVLRRARRKGLNLPVPHAVYIALELLKGLEYAHSRTVNKDGRTVSLNIIHRDVSPPNILLSFSGEVKLTDFGIARASLKVMETVSGIVKGKFDYMSPEQADGSRDLDQRSDLFSVGVVLHEMLAGHHPFRAESELGTIERIKSGRVPRMSSRNPEVPEALEGIVARALQVDREQRYPTATAFKEALDRFFHDSGFIFTHTTLANYVKGLFPEAAQPRPAGQESDDLDLGAAETPGRAAPSATRRAAQQDAARLTSAEPSTLTEPGHASLETHRVDLGRSEFDDEIATAVRPSAAGFDDPHATVVRSGQDVFASGQETVVRRGDALDTPGAEARPRSQRPVTGSRPLPAPPSAAAPPRPTRIGWLGLLLLPVTLGVGFVTGATLGGVGGFFLRPGPGPAQLLVSGPAEAQFFLDGAPFSGGAAVPAGPHALEVRLNGATLFRQDIEVADGATLHYVVPAPR